MYQWKVSDACCCTGMGQAVYNNQAYVVRDLVAVLQADVALVYVTPGVLCTHVQLYTQVWVTASN